MQKDVIGNCTLYLGSCMDVMPTLKKVDMVLTDPPYGINYKSSSRLKPYEKIANDDSTEWVNAFSHSMFDVLKEDSLAVSFYGHPNVDIFMQSWKEAGFAPKSHFCWVKHNMGFGHFSRGQHESAYLLSKGKPPKPARAPSDVIQAAGTGNPLHPTQKPTTVIKTLILPYTTRNDVVLDPFMGSGTTGVACVALDRKFVGIELNQKYYDTACQRITDAYRQPDMFFSVDQDQPKAMQYELLGGES